MSAPPGLTEPVVLVADAGPEAGLGHISRSSALAVALGCRGLDPRCYAHHAEEPFERDGVRWFPLPRTRLPGTGGGVLVVDSYRLSLVELERAAQSSRLVLMHDHGRLPRGAALIVTPASEKSENEVVRLGGLEYVVLRPGFWGRPRRQLEDRATHVLVTTGSGKFDRLGREIALTIASALPAAEVTLVRGPYASASATPPDVLTLNAPDSLIASIVSSDLVVTTGGQTMLEAAAAGTPCVALPIAQNQHRQVARLAQLGAVRAVDPPRADEAAATAIALVRDANQRRELSRTSQHAIDGYGALRVAFRVKRLAVARRL